MIRNRTVLGLITARGGSKGVPGKNVRMAAGLPLIAWTIRAGLASKYLDRLVLSSDDAEIIRVAQAFGCEAPFVRDAALATDSTLSIDVVLDALDRVPGFEWVVLLQPTSPLRTAQDIDGAIERCMEAEAPACVSVCPSDQTPYWMFSVGADGHLTRVLPAPEATTRQGLPPTYFLNGALYVAKCDWIRRTRTFITPEAVAYHMPASRSVDIDVEEDFEAADRALCRTHPDITRDYIAENVRAHSLRVRGMVRDRSYRPVRHSAAQRELRGLARDLLLGAPRFCAKRLRFRSAFRELARYRDSGRGRRALVLGNGPSQGYLSGDVLRMFMDGGHDVHVVNFWHRNVRLAAVTPTALVISDPATLNFARTAGHHDLLIESNRSLLAYLKERPTCAVFCPVERVREIATLCPGSAVVGFADDEVRLWGHTSPMLPRGYVSMTLLKALALARFRCYDEIFVLGMDNTYPRDLYNDINNQALNLERHASGEYYCTTYRNDVATELSIMSDVFNDTMLFAGPPSLVTNLDPYSLVDAFPKVSTIAAGLSRLHEPRSESPRSEPESLTPSSR